MPYKIYIHENKLSYQSDEPHGYTQAVSRDRETAEAVASAFNDTYDYHVIPNGHYSAPKARVYGCSRQYYEEFRIKLERGYTASFEDLPRELLNRLSEQDSRYF